MPWPPGFRGPREPENGLVEQHVPGAPDHRGNTSRATEQSRHTEPSAPHGGHAPNGDDGGGVATAASAAVRVTGNLLYAEWAGSYGVDTVVFREVFDLNADLSRCTTS